MAMTAATVPLDSIQSSPVDLSKPINPSTIKGLTILITGGSSGIGAAFARHWATHGANIIIGNSNQRRGENLVADLRTATSNPHHHFLPLDVTSWPSQLAFFEDAVRLSPTGGIDCVVANAGISLGEESLVFEKPPDYHALLARGGNSRASPPPAPEFRTLDVNLTGVLYTSHLAYAYLPLNHGSGKCVASSSSSEPSPSPSPSPSNGRDRHLLLIGSLAGLVALPTQSLYGVSKHGVTGLFRNLRTTAPLDHGIRVNMLCPYFTATPILTPSAKAMLAGAALAEMDSVVAAATRLVADRGIVGRALAVGPAAGEGDEDAVVAGGGGDRDRDGVGQMKGRDGVWEVYAHDFEQSDLFARRVLGITNLVAGRRGWMGVLRDLSWALVGQPLARLWGS